MPVVIVWFPEYVSTRPTVHFQLEQGTVRECGHTQTPPIHTQQRPYTSCASDERPCPEAEEHQCEGGLKQGAVVGGSGVRHTAGHPASLLPTHVILGELFHLPVPQFLYLENRDNNGIYPHRAAYGKYSVSVSCAHY